MKGQRIFISFYPRKATHMIRSLAVLVGNASNMIGLLYFLRIQVLVNADGGGDEETSAAPRN